jgi:hypothetical protein
LPYQKSRVNRLDNIKLKKWKNECVAENKSSSISGEIKKNKEIVCLYKKSKMRAIHLLYFVKLKKNEKKIK